MAKLEEQFEEEVLNKIEMAKEIEGYTPGRMIKLVTSHGAVDTIRQIIQRGKISDGFDILQRAGRLDLSIEASVVEMKYATLFSDEEVNYCLDLLCEYDYYKA